MCLSTTNKPRSYMFAPQAPEFAKNDCQIWSLTQSRLVTPAFYGTLHCSTSAEGCPRDSAGTGIIQRSQAHKPGGPREHSLHWNAWT